MTKTRYTALSTVVLALVASACSSDGGNNTAMGTGGVGGLGYPGGAPGGGAPGGGAPGGGAPGGGVPGSGGTVTTQGSGGAAGSSAGAGTTGGAPSGGAAGGGGVPSGGAPSGGVPNGGAAGAGTGGSNVAGAAGASGGAAGGGNPGIDLTGTWISEVKTSGKLAVPIVGMADADIDLVIRLSLTKSGGKLNGAFNICKLTTVTKPDPKQLEVTFSPAVIATMKTTISEDDFTAAIGQPVPVPAIRVLSGMDSAKKQVDADNDTHPGVTVPSTIGGIGLTIQAYTGLDIKVALTSTLMDANTISGTTSFTTSGTVFGSDNILLTSGDITVTPSSNAVPFTAKKLAGDVACADVLKNFP